MLLALAILRGGRVGKAYRMLAIVAIALPLAMGCDKSEEERALAAADSLGAARARGETDISNPEMGAKMTVELTDGAMKLSHLELPKGQITIAVMNKGTESRVFEVNGPQTNLKSMPIPPGGSVLMSSVVPAGAFDMMCSDSTGENKRCGTGKLTAK